SYSLISICLTLHPGGEGRFLDDGRDHPKSYARTSYRPSANFRYLDNYLNIWYCRVKPTVERRMMPGEGFKALADPTRRRILELLQAKDLTAGELAEHFDISKPSLSHHLATLKNAGLVTDERHGQNIIYSLNTTVMQDLIGWFMGFVSTKEDERQ
ncbi:autorepressor SdpR family transcription factor, partial [uncultured Bifidobacterium sp.]|uniref:autorepressor SdpR family transcription factor n=2 Tax=Bifidobacterium TaxID=1678 RepID=UPI00260AA702